MPPRLSVCIPTYCGAEHLGAAIESVLNQDFSDYELLIIDDNSPDHTAQVVAKYQDARIRYIKNSENLGPEGNWNKCLTEAQGQYFKLLPHDDVLAPTCLSRQVATLDNDIEQTLALVFCKRQIIGHNGRVIASRGYPGGKEGVIDRNQAIKNSIRKGTNLIGEPGAVMFRYSLAEKVGAFDGSISYIIDLDYWFRLLLHGDAYYMDAPLASFRVAPGSWSLAIGNKQHTDFNAFIDKVAADPRYRLSAFDTRLGKAMALLNNGLRLVFYKLFVSR